MIRGIFTTIIVFLSFTLLAAVGGFGFGSIELLAILLVAIATGVFVAKRLSRRAAE